MLPTRTISMSLRCTIVCKYIAFSSLCFFHSHNFFVFSSVALSSCRRRFALHGFYSARARPHLRFWTWNNEQAIYVKCLCAVAQQVKYFYGSLVTTTLFVFAAFYFTVFFILILVREIYCVDSHFETVAIDQCLKQSIYKEWSGIFETIFFISFLFHSFFFFKENFLPFEFIFANILNKLVYSEKKTF